MDEQCALIFQQARNNYSYPAAYVEIQTNVRPVQDADIAAPGFVFHPAEHGELTTFAFDEHLGAGLRSPDPLERRRAILSVLYWGYSSGPDARARAKVRMLVNPENPARFGIANEQTLECLTNAIEAVDSNDFGRSISALSDLAQFGRTPFASKLIAFLRPEAAGIYDNRIGKWLNGARQLQDPTWEPCFLAGWNRELLAGGVGGVSRLRVQYKYAAWCWFLQHRARELNQLGHAFRWNDPKRGLQAWRAIDVERAIFQSIVPGGG